MDAFLLVLTIILMMVLLKKRKEIIIYPNLVRDLSPYCDKIKLRSSTDKKIPHWGILYKCLEETTWFHHNGMTRQTLIHAKVAYDKNDHHDHSPHGEYSFVDMQVLMMTSDAVNTKDGWLGLCSKNADKNELNLIVSHHGYHYIREILINKKNDGFLFLMTDENNQFKLDSSILGNGFLVDKTSQNARFRYA